MGNYHDKYDSFYQGRKWKQLRAIKFAAAHGLCERCLTQGIIREGKEVHHKIPIDKNWGKRYDFDNLICLCAECHNEMHGRISPLQEFNRFWESMNVENAESKPG